MFQMGLVEERALLLESLAEGTEKLLLIKEILGVIFLRQRTVML